ncbi:putative inorganic phosphate cotransporter [Thrips palmi]|uniref:Inorganic phosphate cotransporter n=1 Tax=Thrips palmi TaxID=161013 RepID=A0A6P8Y2E4_THRPL|nr:putative inorganic phosphate cotransporter [Thrips palmi]XP_034230466.1 putative inorganic phosphate cotransporter [Thrips palmi]
MSDEPSDFLDDNNAGLINASRNRETAYGTTSLSQPSVVDTNDTIKARFVVGFMGFLGLALVYAMRVNLSVAIVAMVNSTTTDDNTTISDVCPRPPSPDPNPEPKSRGEFDWDERTQGLILGSFFYGYVLTQVPGGRLAEQYGGKRIFGWGIFFTALFTILSPPAARMGQGYFIFIRILEGLGEGVTFPSMCAMLARWIPPLERNTYAAAVYSGSNFGTIIAMPLSGYLASVTWMGGWPLAFYVFGGLGIIWSIVWWLVIYDSPSTHPKISPQERDYIQACLGPENAQSKDDSDFPWVEIFSCTPFWAIMVTQCGMAWAFYTQLTEMPTYMSNILHFSLQANSVLTSVPYLTSWISSLCFSRVADWLIAKEYLTPVASFKIFNSFASIVPSIGFIGAALAGCDRQAVIIIMGISGAFVGAQYAGNQMNHVALSPRYAGTMYGMTNGVANLCGFLAPYTIGSIIDKNETVWRWQLVFFLAAAVNITTNIVYVFLGSAEEQPFNRPHPHPKQNYDAEIDGQTEPLLGTPEVVYR